MTTPAPVVSNVEDLGNQTYRCTVTVPTGIGLPAGLHEKFAVVPGDIHGIGPLVRKMIEAGDIQGAIAPYVPPTE